MFSLKPKPKIQFNQTEKWQKWREQDPKTGANGPETNAAFDPERAKRRLPYLPQCVFVYALDAAGVCKHGSLTQRGIAATFPNPPTWSRWRGKSGASLVTASPVRHSLEIFQGVVEKGGKGGEGGGVGGAAVKFRSGRDQKKGGEPGEGGDWRGTTTGFATFTAFFWPPSAAKNRSPHLTPSRRAGVASVMATPVAAVVSPKNALL